MSYNIIRERAIGNTEIAASLIGFILTAGWAVLLLLDVEWSHFVGFAAIGFTWYGIGRSHERKRK